MRKITDDYIEHLTDGEFADCCKEFEKYGLVFSPPSYDWHDYLDVGFSSLSNRSEEPIYVYKGFHEYIKAENGILIAEETIRVVHMDNKGSWNTDTSHIIDSVDELRKLIKETFNIK